MQNKRVVFKIKCVLAVVLIIVVLFLYYLIIQTGIVVGANKEMWTNEIRNLKQNRKQSRQ